MKRCWGVYLPVMIILAGVMLSLGGEIKAGDQYQWIDGSLSSRLLATTTSDQALAHPYCEAGEKYRYAQNPSYTIYNGLNQYISQKVSGSCWRTSGGWTSNGDTFIKAGASTGFTNNQFGQFHGNNFITITNYNSDISSSAKRITSVENPDFNIVGRNGLQYIDFKFPTDKTWSAKDSANNEQVYSSGYSLNDEWLVFQGKNGIYRTNIITKSTQLFSYSRPVSGNGASYDIQISVTDDGRYVLLAAGGNNGTVSSINIYDVESCLMTQPSAQYDTAECRKRDIKNNLGLASIYDRPAAMYFTPDGHDLIYVNAKYDAGIKAIRYTKNILSSATATSVGRVDYLALGDSFSSGEGDLDGAKWYRSGTNRDGEKYPWSKVGVIKFPYYKEVCHQSKRSYPYLLADNKALPFVNVTCSGSTLEDILNVSSNTVSNEGYMGRFRQFDDKSVFQDSTAIKDIKNQAITNFFPGRAAQIEFVSKYKPAVATIGIGGNDINFASKLQACLAPTTCAQSTSLRQANGYEIRGMYQRYVSLFRQLKQASMTTKYYAVGYPQFVSDNPLCADVNVSLDKYERIYIRQSVSYLNKIIKAAADSSGFIYLNIEDALAGNQLCDLSIKPAVNGIAYGDDINPINSDSSFKFIGNESFHPTNLAHALEAAAISQQISPAGLSTFDPCSAGCTQSAGIPAVPAYFEEQNTSDQVSNTTKLLTSVTNDVRGGVSFVQSTGKLVIDTAKSIGEQTVSNIKFMPNANIQVKIYSEPVTIANVKADAGGNVTSEVDLPGSLPYGLHTLALYGTGDTGEKMMMYQPLYIYQTLGDLDGNNIPDSQQKCGLLVPALDRDKDHDGLDDACDPYINPDTTPPVVIGRLSAVTNQNGWINHDSMISWTATDDVDGSSLAQPEATVVNQSGEHIYRSQPVCDAAGNCATGSLTVKLDKTPPGLGGISWTVNPKLTTESSMMTVPAGDEGSGLDRVEYFVGSHDPGPGQAAPMKIDGAIAAIENATDYQVGLYNLSVRARDQAGNWSQLSDGSLVVYDPAVGTSVQGAGLASLQSSYSGLLSYSDFKPTTGLFGVNARYVRSTGQMKLVGGFRMKLLSKPFCRAADLCRSAEFSATKLQVLLKGGNLGRQALLQGKGVMMIDRQPTELYFRLIVTPGQLFGRPSGSRIGLALYHDASFKSLAYQFEPSVVDLGMVRVDGRW